MTGRCARLAALMAIAAGPVAAEGSFADVPLEIITTRSELIVIAEVGEAGEPTRLRLKVPDMPQPTEMWVRRYKLSLKRVIKEDPPAAKPAKKPQAARSIDVFAQTPQPPAPGRPVLYRSDVYHVDLRVGQSYVLILRKMPGKTEYYLPSYPKNCGPESKDNIARVETAADVGKWPWGKAVKGLQIALVSSRHLVDLRAVRQAARGPNGRMGQPVTKNLAYVQAVVALRNVSEKAITVNLYPEDKSLKITAAGPGGKTVSPDLYGALARMDLRAFGPWYTAKVDPNQVLFVDAMGEAKYGTGYQLPLSPGKWKFEACYTATRKADARDGGKLWTGKLESAPVEVEVKAASPAPARAG